MESEISEKVQRLTRILAEEANKFPRITVGQYSTGVYGYDWKVYLNEEQLRAAFRHELRTFVRSQAATGVSFAYSSPVGVR